MPNILALKLRSSREQMMLQRVHLNNVDPQSTHHPFSLSIPCRDGLQCAKARGSTPAKNVTNLAAKSLQRSLVVIRTGLGMLWGPTPGCLSGSTPALRLVRAKKPRPAARRIRTVQHAQGGGTGGSQRQATAVAAPSRPLQSRPITGWIGSRPYGQQPDARPATA